MFDRVASCFIALSLVTLVYGSRHDDLLVAGYEYFPGVGYYYFGTNKGWDDAQKVCTSSKARLAVINSEEERQTVVSFLSDHTKDQYVFGGFTNLYEIQYVTTEGYPLKETGYTNWEEGKPSGIRNRCGVINTITGELSEEYCDPVRSFICEHQLWANYTHVEGIGYYKLHTEGKQWIEAYEICKSEGAHLLVIDSQAEADAVMQIFNEQPDTRWYSYAYIGIRAVRENWNLEPTTGTILTVLGTSVSDLGYVKWYSNNPSVGNTFFCGVLRRDSTYSMMQCLLKETIFFCEKELQEFVKRNSTNI